MTLVILSPQARADLREIVDYRALFSDQAVDRLTDGFDQAVLHLERFPRSGSPREDLGKGIRAFVLRAFQLNLYYHVAESDEMTRVLIVRVLRHERDIDPDDIEAGL